MSSVIVLYLVLLLVGGAVLLSLLADRLKLPPAIPLVLGGIGLALFPGAPVFNVDPSLILVLFLPPLLLYAAYFTVWSDFRAEFRPIAMLSFGAVAFTTASVGLVAHWIVPALPWPACFALGAIVSPPDAVSARAVFERLSIPGRIQTILEGESLVNDASGLVLYRFAVAAALSGAFSAAQASLTLIWLIVGGIAMGLAVGGSVTWALRRLHDSRYIVVTTMLAAYGAYIGAEAAHASGVLAVVSCGLLVGWRQHELLSAEARSDSHAVWDLVVFILEALVFVLIGLSLHGILDRMGGRAHVWEQAMPLAIASTLTVVVSRFLWIFPSTLLARLVTDSSKRDSLPVNSLLTIMSWAGMRGVVSLAAALALPLKFPGRDPILFSTFAVILTTVLVQGLTLGPLVKWLHVPEPEHPTPEAAPTLSFAETRVKINAAAVRALETIVKPDDGGYAHPQLLEEYRSRMRATERLRDDDETISEESHAHFKAALAATQESRAELLRLLHAGEIHESVAHDIETELDLEEIRWRKLAEAIPDPNAPESPDDNEKIAPQTSG
jgi:monovalent cation/hydrogen antiporter